MPAIIASLPLKVGIKRKSIVNFLTTGNENSSTIYFFTLSSNFGKSKSIASVVQQNSYLIFILRQKCPYSELLLNILS